MCKGDINRHQPKTAKINLGLNHISCVKFQNRPYKASHSEYLQNVVFLIYTCLPELCLISIGLLRRTQFVF